MAIAGVIGLVSILCMRETAQATLRGEAIPGAPDSVGWPKKVCLGENRVVLRSGGGWGFRSAGGAGSPGAKAPSNFCTCGRSTGCVPAGGMDSLGTQHPLLCTAGAASAVVL